MRYIYSLTFTLAALMIACTAAPYPLASGCKDYVLISSRGTMEPQGPSSAFTGVIKTVLGTLPNGVEVDTVYPANLKLNFSIGTDWVTQHITNGLVSCPQQKFALLGYSQGAMVSSAALERLPNAADGAIKAALFFGNPFHVPQRPGNVDEHGGHSTAAASGMLSRGNPGGANVFGRSGRLLDVCFTRDIFCDSRTSFDADTHGRYKTSEEVQKMGADFLIRYLRK